MGENIPGSESMQPRKTDVDPSNPGYQELTRADAEKAHAKRDAFHFTKKGALEDQKKFESAQRIHDRALGFVESSMYSPRHVSNREDNEREDALRADELNARRTVLDRLLGRNKMTARDVLRDEADRMNEVTDHLVMQEDGTMHPQDAHDEIARSTEFLPDTYSEFWQNGEQEALADLLARIQKADSGAKTGMEWMLNHGSADPVHDFVKQQIEMAQSREEQEALEKAFKSLMLQKLDTFFRSRDIPSAIHLLESKTHIPLTVDLLNEFPEEFIRYEEIKRGLRNRIAEEGERNARNARELNSAFQKRVKEPA